MHFVDSMPWPLKMAVMAVYVLKRCPADGAASELGESDFRVRYCAAGVVTVAALLPSLFFSVKQRRATTCLVTESTLMLAAMGFLMCTLYSRDPERHTHSCISWLVLSTHFFYMLGRAAVVNPHLLNYSTAVATLASASCVATVTTLCFKLQCVDTHAMYTVPLLFAGEVLGLAVFVANSMLRTLSDGVEDFLQQ